MCLNKPLSRIHPSVLTLSLTYHECLSSSESTEHYTEHFAHDLPLSHEHLLASRVQPASDILDTRASRAPTPTLTPPRLIRPRTGDGAGHQRPNSSPLRTRGVLRPEPTQSLNELVSTELSQKSVDELTEVISRATTAHSGSRAGTASKGMGYGEGNELAVGSVALSDDWSVHSGTAKGFDGGQVLSGHSHHSNSMHSQYFPGSVDNDLELETLEKGSTTLVYTRTHTTTHT
jgi:hypothetical protein